MTELSYLQKVSDIGFTLFFGISVLVFVFKFLPKLIKSWSDFTNAIEKNTQITDTHYKETVDLTSQLKELKQKLIEHDMNTLEIKDGHEQLRQTQEEILRILQEMQDIVRGKSNG